ncbi:TerD domain containing protein, putative [Leishmania donovani]|uniref:TerD domain containing protein, putative n=1 Tax=Leishmania donovani TaxID=5661 RepID=A0A3S7X4T6_LEIDO|nr:TerD domain containing protein, putative [Leishmania donovani]
MSCADVRQKVFRVPGSIVLSVGLSWDFIGADPVDLDLSAVCFTKEGRFLDVVFFNHLFPEGTDETALRAHHMVDPELLPYMFLSGDSTVGGEDENQLPGLALAAGRRHQQLRRRARHQATARGGMLGTRDYTNAAANVFDRLYEEEQLADVQRAADEAIGYDEDTADDEVGAGQRPLRRRPCRHRELADEVLTFVMSKIPSEADVIFITVSSYTGQDFTVLSRAKLIVYNESTSERVGVMNVRQTTENGTANLAAMLIRLPPSQEEEGVDGTDWGSVHGGAAAQEWDLRELNVRTFGYSFVDTLPLMMDVLGVPRRSLLDVLQNVPDYSLSKVKAGIASWTLSDVRLGVGWSGEHDIDAFLVFLDENHNYVDHLYPKNGKLRSMARDAARHSGDALCGSNAAGDEEFIDLLTYRVPGNVSSIVVGATWMESFGPEKRTCKSIFDVPDLYLRLQNRTVMNPHSMEVDRWPLNREAHDPKVKKQLPTSYKDAENKEQPVRAVVLGALVKTGTQPFGALFPNGRRIDQYFHKHGRPLSVSGTGQTRSASVTSRADDSGGVAMSEFEADREEEVPLFQLVPIHQYVPVDPREGLSRVIPYLQCMMAYAATVERHTIAAARRRVAEAEAARRGNATPYSGGESSEAAPLDTTAGTADTRLVLSRENNMVGWNPATSASLRRGGRGETTVKAAREQAASDTAETTVLRDRYECMWSKMKHYDNRTDLFAIAVQFLEVVEVQPQMPDRFRCHGEAWVFGQTNCIVPAHGSVSVFDNKPYRSPVLVDREKLAWADASSSSSGCGYFIVHKYDRLRVMLFETASVGVADLDLLSMDALWAGKDNVREGTLADRFNPVECNVRLEGGVNDAGTGELAYSAEVRLRVSRVPLNAAMKRLQQQADRINAQRGHVQKLQNRYDERYYNEQYKPCTVM